jgi:serine phosphatase RsbU (regulator of sigma subunit)
MAYSYHNLGSIYYNLEEYSKAIDYFTRALAINQKLKNNVDIASNHNNLGSAYLEQKEYSKALWHFNQAYNLFISTGHERYAAICAGNIGCIYEDQGNYQQAIEAHNKAMAIHEMFQDVQSQCNCYYNLGRAYAGLNDYKLSESMYYKGLSLAKKISNTEIEYEINFSLHELYVKKGDYKRALEHFKTYTSIKDSIFNEQKQLQITEIETKYESEKKEQQITLQKYQIATQSAELKQEQFKQYGLILILILVIGLVFVILKAYTDKQAINKILADKNKSITESITYAQKIQNAVLPPEERIKALIPEHFILFKPRDIVSGDFFWVAEKNNRTIVAIADCTGHGVPGAFMSMLGVAFLNEIVNRNQELQANLILNELRNRIKESLNQSGRENEAQDGIDIALCVIDKDKRELQFAGAYSPLYIIKNHELIRYKADLMPIGYQIKEKPSFTNNTIKLDPEDIIYLFSDGYSDQLGGDDCIRLKTEPFKKMLLEIHQLPLSLQKEILETNLKQWKGDYPQIDDILVMGFKIA